MLTSLYIGNLHYKADENAIYKLFKGVAFAKNIKFMTRKGKPTLKTGVAFVQVDSMEKAQNAIKRLHNKEHMGRTLNVRLANNSK
jgi:RNA recognition motif-containing protein